MTIKTYALIRTSQGSIERRQNFEEGTQPTLAAAKDLRWILDEQPSFSAATQIRTEASPIASNATSVPYVIAARPLDDVKAARKTALAAKRYEKETSGTLIGGMPVSTDERSQSKITGAALAATLDAGYSVNWKTEAGFVELDAQTLLALAQGVRTHVQACFDNEMALTASIDSAQTAAAVLDVNIDQGWP